MAHVEEGGKKRGRAKNVELNLVPVIDLMSVLITFLLITAVWNQVNMMQIGSSLYGKQLDDKKPIPPPKSDVVLRIDIKPIGYVLTVGKQVISLPVLSGSFDDPGLMAQLQRVKQLYPEKTDVVVQMADDLPYEQLIRGMDDCLQSGFPAISVATGAPQ
jgi:biopolymer transport protein ExbD